MPRPKASEKLKNFVYHILYLNESKVRAYIHAGYSQCKEGSYGTVVNANSLFKTPACQQEYDRQCGVLSAKKQAECIINRDNQVKKLEALRLKAETEHDLPTALGCIREQNSVYGLRIEVQAQGEDKLAEIDAEIKAKAEKIAPEIFNL